MSDQEKPLQDLSEALTESLDDKVKLPQGFAPLNTSDVASKGPSPIPPPTGVSLPEIKEAEEEDSEEVSEEETVVLNGESKAEEEVGDDESDDDESDDDESCKDGICEIDGLSERSAETFQIPKVGPVVLDPTAVYSPEETEEGSDEEPQEEKIEVLEAENPKPEGEEPVQAEEESGSTVPDPEVMAALVAQKLKSSDSEMEVLGPEKSRGGELALSDPKVSKWAFWKRPSKRDQQLARISEGYLEMIDLVRAIRNQMESQNENNIILRDSLAHLPEAMKGLDRFSKSQQVVGEALSEINGQMKRQSEKEERLADSMDGFNETLKGMDGTSKATMQTFDRVQERMRDSDIRMENLFQNVQNTEEKVGDTMVRLQRNMSIMQIVFLVCLLIVIGVLVFTVVTGREDLGPNPAPNPQQEEVDTPSPGAFRFVSEEMNELV